MAKMGEKLTEQPLKRPWGTLRVIREKHFDVYPDASKLGNATALFLEGVHSQSISELRNNHFFWLENLKANSRMSSLYNEQVKDYFNFDVYAGEKDAAVLRALIGGDFERTEAIKGAGIVGAIGLATAAVMKPTSRTGSVSRRLFMGAGAAAALHAAPLVVNQELARGGIQTELPLHTERGVMPYVIFFRNLVFAHKLEYATNLLQGMRGKKVDAAAVVGRLHGRLPTAVSMDSEERAELIKTILRELKSKVPAGEFEKLLESINTMPHLHRNDDGTDTEQMLTMNLITL
jgi:hypothetical protein